MITFRQYLLMITTSGILCSLIAAVGPQKGINSHLIKMICGIFLLLTLTGKIGKVSLSDFTLRLPAITAQAQSASERGEASAREAIGAGIKQAAETYILDKARMYNADLKVEVKILWSDTPVLTEVRLDGSCSPYARQQLSRTISQNLGIPEEAQIWTG